MGGVAGGTWEQLSRVLRIRFAAAAEVLSLDLAA
ncbi:hypothetical protein LINGRAPRIM_LOCUS167 [Linum grandiflorum]